MSSQPSRFRRALRVLWDWTRSIGGALLVFLLLRTFLIEGYHIPSGSMERTLLVGDWLFVNKALYGAEVPLLHAHLPPVREPRRGDVIVFDSKTDPDQKIVKRLIGLPGDTLAMRASHLVRNGVVVEEPYAVHTDTAETAEPWRDVMRGWQLSYLAADTAGYNPDLQNWGPIVVPPDSLFVLGDNRENSLDSRFWGFLPSQNLRGSPMFVYFSYDAGSNDALPWVTDVRWGRVGERVR
ncbi:MAG TPA: signal peptidase I [Gemmatimonadales bacterium]|nr:signal peptidase I [Gemmatimonadales bacterium]